MCTSLLFINWISSTIHHFSSQRRFLNLPLSQIFNKMPTSYSFGRICQSWSKFWQLPVSIPFYLKFKRGRHLTNLLLIALIQRCNMQCRELKQNCKRCAWKGNCFSDWSSCCQVTSLSFDSVDRPCSFRWSGGIIWQICFWLSYYRNAICDAHGSNRNENCFPDWSSHSLEHALSFSPLIFSWKENKLSPNFFLPLGDPHNLFYNLFQCQLQIAAWSLARNRKSDQNADFLFTVFLLWSEIVRWLFDIQ